MYNLSSALDIDFKALIYGLILNSLYTDTTSLSTHTFSLKTNEIN